MTRFSLADQIADVYVPFRLLDARRRSPGHARPLPPSPKTRRATGRVLALCAATAAIAVIAVIATSAA